LFTSGSTGQPKGVLYSHAAAVHRVQWMWDSYSFSENERVAHRSSINFIDAYWELFGPLAHGASVVLPPVAADKDPAVLLSSLLQHEVTHLVAVPSLLHTLLELSDVGGEPQQLALRSLICSGETLQPDVLKQIRRQLPDCVLFNTYGTTETWDATVYRCQARDLRAGKVPIGEPLPGVSTWVLDDQLHPLPPGVWGQLHVGGVGLPLAYVGLAAANPLFVRSKDPLVPDVDLYPTGDLVRWNVGGELEIGGRCDRQINVRGFRIEPAEIERQLAAHPDVSQTAVHMGIDTSGREYVLAYLVPTPGGSEVSSLVLQDFLRGWLPDLIVPTVFVWLKALPLTPSGKTDYLSLPAPDWQLSRAAIAEYVAPVSDTERTLAVIWQSVLDVEQVGRNDDFFALHGHSLMAAKLMSRVCDAFATDLPLQCLFENPTLRGFAASVDAIRWAMNADSDTSAESGEDREVLRF
jgi:iturin family lipopeptide synthetase A